MTTSNESGIAPRPAGGEAPVWQPELPQAEPQTQIDDSALGDAATGAPAVQETAAGAQAPARPHAPARRTSSTAVLLAISAMIALGGIGFAVGRATATGQSGTGQTTTGLTGGQNGVPGLGPNASGAPGFGDRGPDAGLASGTATISGTVVSVDATSITVRLASGQTVTLAIGSSTTYHHQTSATSADVTAGATVVVQASGTDLVSGSGAAAASASAGVNGTRTATDVTITGK